MIDITFDFETCALSPNAAVMSMAAVVWNRYADDTPFIEDAEILKYPTYTAHVDLRSMFVDGFTFDSRTAAWWASQSKEAKANVLSSDSDDAPCMPVQDVIENFFSWIGFVENSLNTLDVNIWCQGTDFDMAILRNICFKYSINIPISYKNFRDHRTYFMESAAMLCDIAGLKFEPSRAYTMVEDYKDGVTHSPEYDCKRSIYTTWQMMKHLRCLGAHKD